MGEDAVRWGGIRGAVKFTEGNVVMSGLNINAGFDESTTLSDIHANLSVSSIDRN